MAVASADGVELGVAAVATGAELALSVALVRGEAVGKAAVGDDVGTAPVEQADTANAVHKVAALISRISVTVVASTQDLGAYSSDDRARARVGTKFAPTYDMSGSSG